MRSAIFGLLIGVALAHTAAAHHSFSATYLETEEAVIEGEIVAVMFRNPHVFVQVEAPDQSGVMQRWAIEWAAASALDGEVQRDTLKPGDHVIVTGNPGRNPIEHKLRMKKIVRPADGWQWGGNVT